MWISTRQRRFSSRAMKAICHSSVFWSPMALALMFATGMVRNFRQLTSLVLYLIFAVAEYIPLMLASFGGHFIVAQYLLEHLDCSLEDSTSDGVTAYRLAVDWDRHEMVKVLQS